MNDTISIEAATIAAHTAFAEVLEAIDERREHLSALPAGADLVARADAARAKLGLVKP